MVVGENGRRGQEVLAAADRKGGVLDSQQWQQRPCQATHTHIFMETL